MSNPFVGTWTANLEKSRRHANHQFQSATMTFEMKGESVSMTHAGINMAGKHESGTSELRPDGQEHPIPQAPGVVVSYTRDADIASGKKFRELGLQSAAGVPLQCHEPPSFRTFRLGLFGLDKLQNIDRTVTTLERALAQLA